MSRSLYRLPAGVIGVARSWHAVSPGTAINELGDVVTVGKFDTDQTVLDVSAKLSAQVRGFATGNGRKTDPVVVMSMLVDRRDDQTTGHCA